MATRKCNNKQSSFRGYSNGVEGRNPILNKNSVPFGPSAQNHLTNNTLRRSSRAPYPLNRISKRPTTTTRNVAKMPSNVHQESPPPVTPRTILPQQLPIESVGESNTSVSVNVSRQNKESSNFEKQVMNVASINEEKRTPLPPITKKNVDLSSEKDSVRPVSTKTTEYPPGVCGLINTGNSCYMNSALQCLSNVPELTEWALSRKDISSKENTTVYFAYISFIQEMWSGKYNKINPYRIKQAISSLVPLFADSEQKDSHEFMNYLLNALGSSSSESIINKLFYIRTESKVTCACCSIDTANEITTFLPLPIPNQTSNRKDILLEDLIRDFCLEEDLDGMYYCCSCQQYTQAKQKTSILSPLPSVLIIQLKRFPFDGTNRKINTFVRYKLQHRNLLSDNDIYQLCAVSSHIGSLSSGHYTTLAKNKLTMQWYEFNDELCNKISSKTVITQNAYVLIYLKSDTVNDLIFE